MPAAQVIAPLGHSKPRLAPPMPARSDIEGLRESAACMGISLIPWQDTAGRYLEALDPDDRLLFREVGVIVGRQNGKTDILKPTIHKRLLAGRRMMHTAQDRYLPKATHAAIADHFWAEHPELFPKRNGRPTRPRYANGQEELRLSNGGFYRIVAPTPLGARGDSVHDVLVDELMAMYDWGFINAAKPTMSLPNPQMIYLSNMGADEAVVLKALRARREADPSLAYLEWSADPELAADDPLAWAQSNPMLGREPEGVGSKWEVLTKNHRSASLDGTMADYEAEYLCRGVPTLRQLLVTDDKWQDCAGELEASRRPMMAISYDPAGTRASVALAWWQSDDSIGLRLLYDVPGDPVNPDKLGKELRAVAKKNGVVRTGYDPMTDMALAAHLVRTEPITGKKFANASATFTSGVEGKTIRWQDAAAVGEDLVWTSRKDHDESGSFQAVRADDDRPITAALAAIRAVGMVSLTPRSTPTKRKPAMGF